MSDQKVDKSSTITITFGLDNNGIPVKMSWESNDQGTKEPEECKAMLLSLFSKDQLETLKIDLWTADMKVAEMDRFFYQTLRGLADTYAKSTKNVQLAAELQGFAHYFGEKTELIPKNQ